jgi:hypothetical protein
VAGFNTVFQRHVGARPVRPYHQTVEIVGRNQIDRANAERGSEQSVTRRWCAATLDIAENGHPRLGPGRILDQRPDLMTDAT